MTSRQTKLGLFLAAAIVLVVCGTFGMREFVRWRSEVAERRHCENNLKTLGLAIHNYHSVHGHLPPAYVLGKDGKPWHSWRVLILPQLNRGDLYEKYHFDEPWNGPRNIQLIDQMPDVFGCPADEDRAPGKTNYVAIVGSQTAWPGPRTPTLEEISSADGTSNTIMLMETAPSDIAWTEPRDITMQELFADDDDVGPRFASKHDGIVHVAMGDGAVRQVRFPIAEGGRRLLHAYATAWSGAPYMGEWLPGEEELVNVGEFPREVNAAELKGTDVVAHMHGSMSAQKNAIWCATAQIAWDDLRQAVGATPKIVGSEIAEGLGKTPFPRSALDPSAYVSRMGLVRDGIIKKITDDMDKRFPGVKPSINADDRESDIIMYCFLQKNLPFKTRFDSLKEPLVFHAADGDVKAKSFGFKKLKDAKSDENALREEVNVLCYDSDDDFVIRLQTKSDEIVLAKVAPAPSLNETLTNVRKRIADHPANRSAIEDDEMLVVPLLAFNILGEYGELEGKEVVNFRTKIPDGVFLAQARQSIRFLLNERGARIESEYVDPAFIGDGHEKIVPPKPRHFVLDKPFLLYVKEKKADVPYLVLWVANGEIMQKFEASGRKP